MLTCQFCGYEDTVDSDCFQIDKFNQGFWCELCDGYTYINNTSIKHKFTLILEDKNAEKIKVGPSTINLAKRISPYRYPGGKSKIVDYLYSHLQQTKTKNWYLLLAVGEVLN